MSCEEDRYQGVSKSPGTPKIASKPPDAQREEWKRFSLTASVGTNPADMWPQTPGLQTVRQSISVVQDPQFVIFCFGRPGELIQTDLIAPSRKDTEILELLKSWLHYCSVRHDCPRQAGIEEMLRKIQRTVISARNQMCEVRGKRSKTRWRDFHPRWLGREWQH